MVDMINMIISWAPTLLFLLFIVFSFLTGLMRGLRKSLILLYHALGAAIVCIVLFFLCTRSEQMDATLLVLVNKIMGSEAALQNMLKVSAECATIREVIMEVIYTSMAGSGEGIVLILKENGAYFLTIIDLVYNIVFALVFSIVYLVLVFILYIIYFIFYPQRRYKRKIKRRNGVYKKRALFGGLVGACRGTVVGLIFLSFLGNTLYVVTGGNGESKLTEHSFGDETLDTVYSIYRSVDNYGSTGIYKVLNTFKDKEGQPYYLFAADLVFSGRLEDENLDIHENVKFREEIGAYVGFAKDTANLLVKYGGEDINAMINGTSESSMDAVVEVMENKEFQAEFETLINEFDAQTYFINLGFAFINSVINNIDELGFASSMDPAMLDMVKILFKEGHYSQYIPDERDAVSQVNYARKKNSQNETLPYLSVNKLIQKKDILAMFKLLTTILTSESEENESQEQAALRTIKEVLPFINELSIFSSERKEEIDPVLTRLYCFVENVYLTEEGVDGITYAELKDENISWIGEINSLVDMAVDVLQIVENVYTPEQEIIDSVISVFDSNQEKYTENMQLLDNITGTIEGSRILGKVLSSSVMKSTLIDAMSNMVPNMYVDESVSFVNKYDNQGNVVEYGELHQVFEGLKLIGKANNGQVLKSLVNSQEMETTELLEQVSAILKEKDENGNTVTDYLLDSKLLHSAISAVMVNASEGEGSILYVSDSVLQTNSNNEVVNLVKKEALKEILDELPDVIDIIKDLDQENLGISSITPILESDVFERIINKNNPIIEGTVAKLLVNTLSGNEMIIIPKELETIENWFSTQEKPGEIKNIVNFVLDSDIKIDEIIEGEDKLGALSKLTDEDIANLFKSKILHYTISNYIDGLEMGELQLIIPNTVKEPLTDDVIASLIKKDELEVLFNQLLGITLSTDIDGSGLMSEFVSKFVSDGGEMLESDIIVASLANFLINNGDILNVPTHLMEQGQLSALENLTDDNLWHKELHELIYTLEEMFNISDSQDGEFIFNSSEFDDKASVLLNALSDTSIVDPSKKKIEIIYKSEIMVNTISSKLDAALISDSLLTADEALEAKESKNYTLMDSSNFEFVFYSYNEILALSDCLYAFGISDIVGIENSDLSSIVKDKLTSLNEDADSEKYGAGVSTIDLMYRSKLIGVLFSKELDKVLTSDMIEPDVLSYVKNSQKVYPQVQLEKLVDSINALNITDMDAISGIEFEGVKASLQDDVKFEKIYGSEIVAGIISKKVYDITNSSGSILMHYTKAYESNVNIYKKQEIKSLVDLIGDFDINNMNMSELTLTKDFIHSFIYDDNGNTASYLIVATLSNNLLTRNEETLVIPSSTINNEYESIINPSDLADLLEAIFALQESDNISVSDLDTSTQSTLPKVEAQDTLINSIIIRASITNMIRTINAPEAGEDSHLFVDEIHIDKTTDKDGEDIVIINVSQMKAIFKVLGGIAEPGDPLEIPKFTYHAVLTYNIPLEDVYEADMCRITMIQSILEVGIVLSDMQEEVYDLWHGTTDTIDSLSKAKIENFISSVSV